jgi:glycosyltransferase involved in cell wall biosynthesis
MPAADQQGTESFVPSPQAESLRAPMTQRVLVIQPQIKLTGGGAIAQQCLVNALRALGNETYTLSLCGNYPSTYPENHFTHRIPQGAENRAQRYSYEGRLVRFLNDAIYEIQPDIIFIGQIWSFFSLISVVRKLKVPIIHVVHSAEYGCLNSMLTQKDTMKVCTGGVGLKCKRHKCESSFSFAPKAFMHLLRNYLMKRYFDGFMCHSRFMLEFMSQQSFGPLYYVPLNVPLETNLDTDTAVDPTAKRTIELLFVGTLSWHKGTVELIDAMRILKYESVRYHLNVIGAGPCRKAVEDTIRRHNLEDHVSMLGAVNKKLIRNYYELSDVVVFPSYFESFGLVALEAMSYNKHLIVSNRGALVEATSGYTKLKVLSQINAREIAEAVIAVKNGSIDHATELAVAWSPVLTRYTANQTANGLREVLGHYL